ncbi:hypothetical protein ABMC89_11225 [Sulfitobacter sp. HNIBRBA3233]|uniref:hypothetical protein n=1 Tax=Sulfitobacter marinivivus TaxID=3158558 RepID=UPI0032DF75A1
MKTENVIPFAEKEIQNRLRDQQITGPFFSSTTASGDKISFSADTIITPREDVGSNRAENVRARIVSADDSTVQLSANAVTLNMGDDSASLEGDVTVVTSSGYRVNTPLITSQISTVELYAPQTVEAFGPIGTLTAGNMTISTPPTGEGTQMLFSGGVKLVYTPN